MFSYEIALSKHHGLIKLSAFCLIALLFITPYEIHGRGQAQQQSSSLLKLRITIDKIEKKSKYVTVGEEIEGRVDLLDVNNNKFDAPKDLAIALTVILPSGETLPKQEVIIKSGHNHEDFKLVPITQPGIVNIQASNQELQPGGTFLEVRAKSKASAKAADRRPIKSLKSKPKPKAETHAASMRRPDELFEPSARLAPVMFAQPASDDPDRDNLDLKIPVEKKNWANGKDEVTVWVFLKKPAPQALDIKLHTPLEDKIIKFEKKDIQGYTTLTSTTPGTVYVKFMASEPRVGLRCSKELPIQFHAPVTGYAFEVFPSRIPFIDKADLVVRLLNNTETVVTDEDYPVSFRVNNDVGKLSDNSIIIKAGRFEERTSFIPVKKGEVIITAIMPGFLNQDQKLEVETPVMFLVLSAIGGLVGGLIAFWVGQNSRWWRIVVGLVTGFVLYWACIFISISSLPRGIVLNILTALALPILGGWLGTEVFNLVLKRLGLIH
jgi:hypothetical protein